MSCNTSYSLGKIDSSKGCQTSLCNNTVCGDENVFALSKKLCNTIPDPSCDITTERDEESCRTGKTCLAIDDQKAMWSEWTIGVDFDKSTGIYKNYKIPMGWVDFKDYGRSGICSPNNVGRMFSDEGCNTYQYNNYQLTIRNENNAVIYVDDYHIPLVALEGPIQCTCVNGSNSDQDGPEIGGECTDENCNRMYLGAQCEDGLCNPTWLNLDDSIIINVEDTASLNLVWDSATKTMSGNVLTTDSNSIELYITPNGVGASLLVDPNPNNITEVTTQGLYTSIVTGNGLTGAGTPTSPLRLSNDTEQCELCNGV